ncbi:hypothetical protein NHX12_021057 [Muraenolepis orangiensis]|uniref:Uncharacterized protein n=1 Tax=Muraenolepis orangiensis TaxID=630683 RepID=A0A9Q0ESD8_9TELE|nr:hypothetical protein NHX12_021057 [Muraenolepis orangiensis]
MTTKGLPGGSHHHAMTCDPSSYDPVTLGGASAHRPYFLGGGEPDHHPADHPYYAQRGPAPDLASCTFPRRYASHHRQPAPPTAHVGGGVKAGGVAKAWGNNNNHSSLLPEEQFDGQAASLRRHDGYHTLQYRRCAAGAGGVAGRGRGAPP